MVMLCLPAILKSWFASIAIERQKASLMPLHQRHTVLTRLMALIEVSLASVSLSSYL
jgi:hypothetical protein